MLLQERQVAYDDLAALVTSNESFWRLRPFFKEVQAILLYRLLLVTFQKAQTQFPSCFFSIINVWKVVSSHGSDSGLKHV